MEEGLRTPASISTKTKTGAPDPTAAPPYAVAPCFGPPFSPTVRLYHAAPSLRSSRPHRPTPARSSGACSLGSPLQRPNSLPSPDGLQQPPPPVSNTEHDDAALSRI
jgi:hypothetical protein